MVSFRKGRTVNSNIEWYLTRIVRDAKRRVLETYDHDVSNAEYVSTTVTDSDPHDAQTVEVIVTRIDYVNGVDHKPVQIKRKDAIESSDVPTHVKVALRQLRRANTKEKQHAHPDP